MKKVLLVGYNYCYENDVMKKYKDVLFVSARDIDTETPERVIALTEMFDAILLMGNNNRMSFLVAAIMLKKEILTEKDYPLEDKGGDSE